MFFGETPDLVWSLQITGWILGHDNNSGDHSVMVLAVFMLLSKGRTKPTLNNSACDFKEKAPDPMLKKIRSRFFRGEVIGESEEKEKKSSSSSGFNAPPDRGCNCWSSEA